MELYWFVKENTHLSRGHFGMDFGWGNGYVCIPKGHPCYEMDYNTIHDKYDIECNGGLTFSEHASKLELWDIPEEQKESWVVGFDTMHLGDTLELWPKSSVEHHTKKLAEQFLVFRRKDEHGKSVINVNENLWLQSEVERLQGEKKELIEALQFVLNEDDEMFDTIISEPLRYKIEKVLERLTNSNTPL